MRSLGASRIWPISAKSFRRLFWQSFYVIAVAYFFFIHMIVVGSSGSKWHFKWALPSATIIGSSFMDMPQPHASQTAVQSHQNQTAIRQHAAAVDSVPKEGEHRLHEASRAMPRVLLYITTHMSVQHQWYLRNCWGEVFRHSALLRASDVVVYANPPAAERERTLGVLERTFAEQKLIVHIANDNKTDNAMADKHTGAMWALWYALEKKLFDGYDWIIRANPDVIVRDDAFLVDSIWHDPKATALLIDCMKNYVDRRGRMQVHTDFFALKRDLLKPRRMGMKLEQNAELSFTEYLDVKGGIEGLRWISGAEHEGSSCRAGAGKPLRLTPVTHVHDLNDTDGKLKNVAWIREGTCPIPFAGAAATGPAPY